MLQAVGTLTTNVLDVGTPRFPHPELPARRGLFKNTHPAVDALTDAISVGALFALHSVKPLAFAT